MASTGHYRVLRMEDRMPDNNQDPGLNAVVIRCWHDLILHGVGLNGPVEPQDSVRVNLRIFSNGDLIHQQIVDKFQTKRGAKLLKLDKIVCLESYRPYLVVVNITGAKCWQGLEGKYLHCIKMGRHRIQLSFTTPRKDMLEKALYWDYYEEMEPMVNRTSSQAGQFPFIEVSMAEELYSRKKQRTI